MTSAPRVKLSGSEPTEVQVVESMPLPGLLALKSSVTPEANWAWAVDRSNAKDAAKENSRGVYFIGFK